MQQLKTRPIRLTRFGRALLEGGVFVVLACITVASAALTKEARHAPALAAVDRVVLDAAPRAMIAAASPASGAMAEPTAVGAALEPAPAQVSPDAVRWFDGRPVRPARTIWMTVTAYSPDARSCGKWADGVTASMKSVWTNAMKSVAADTRLLPFGSLVSVPGYDDGSIVPVLDRGGAIKGARLDVLYPTHSIARKWGVRRIPVTVWEYADEG